MLNCTRHGIHTGCTVGSNHNGCARGDCGDGIGQAERDGRRGRRLRRRRRPGEACHGHGAGAGRDAGEKGRRREGESPPGKVTDPLRGYAELSVERDPAGRPGLWLVVTMAVPLPGPVAGDLAIALSEGAPKNPRRSGLAGRIGAR